MLLPLSFILPIHAMEYWGNQENQEDQIGQDRWHENITLQAQDQPASNNIDINEQTSLVNRCQTRRHANFLEEDFGQITIESNPALSSSPSQRESPQPELLSITSTPIVSSEAVLPIIFPIANRPFIPLAYIQDCAIQILFPTDLDDSTLSMIKKRKIVRKLLRRSSQQQVSPINLMTNTETLSNFIEFIQIPINILQEYLKNLYGEETTIIPSEISSRIDVMSEEEINSNFEGFSHRDPYKLLSFKGKKNYLRTMLYQPHTARSLDPDYVSYDELRTQLEPQEECLTREQLQELLPKYRFPTE